MKKMTVSRGPCDLPNDLIFYILLRIPVKSLIRFKTVSKSWEALITNPYFVRQHYLQQPSSKLLFTKRGHQIGYPLPITFDTTSKDFINRMENAYKHIKPFESENLYMNRWVMGPCFGVFCFGERPFYQERPMRITLYNIATAEIKVVPELKSGKKDGAVSYGFGFGSIDSTIGFPEFKIVSLVNFFEEDRSGTMKCLSHVYTSATNSWKVLNVPCQSHTYDEVGTELNEIIHWMAVTLNPIEEEYFIITFDLKKEVFGRIELPHETHSTILGKQYDQYLSLISYWSITNGGIDIWVMHEGSWVRQARVGKLGVDSGVIFGHWHNVGRLQWHIVPCEYVRIVVVIKDERHEFRVEFSKIPLFNYAESLVSFNF